MSCLKPKLKEYCVLNPDNNHGFRIEAESWDAAQYFCNEHGLELQGEFVMEIPWDPENPTADLPLTLLPGAGGMQ